MPGLEMGSFPVEVGEEGYHHDAFTPLISHLRFCRRGPRGRRAKASTG